MIRSNKPFSVLIGRELSSIEFVRDYIQIRFDGPCITAITDPFIMIDQQRYDRGHPNFCNLLLSFINAEVKAAFIKPGEVISIQFQEGRSINISLRDEDYVTAEAVNFHDDSGKLWVW